MYVYTEIQKYSLGQHKFVWRVFPFLYWCQIRQRRFFMKRKSGPRPRQGLLPSWCWGQCLCLFWYLCWYWCWIYLVNCPTRQFLILFIGSLHWNGHFEPKIFANLTNYMSPDGEFRCCHLAFGVFRPKIYVYIEELWVKSREFPKMTIQIICYLNFRKAVNMVGERKTAAHEFPKMKITNYLYRHFRKFANCRLPLPAHSVPT